jgi:preprotein translocase subunit YajC
LIIAYAVVLFAFYFFYMRPRQRKQKAQRESARQVEIGDKVQTIGGLVGVVTRRDDSSVTIRCSSGAELDFVPAAIARRVDPVEPTPEAGAA